MKLLFSVYQSRLEKLLIYFLKNNIELIDPEAIYWRDNKPGPIELDKVRLRPTSQLTDTALESFTKEFSHLIKRGALPSHSIAWEEKLRKTPNTLDLCRALPSTNGLLYFKGSTAVMNGWEVLFHISMSLPDQPSFLKSCFEGLSPKDKALKATEAFPFIQTKEQGLILEILGVDAIGYMKENWEYHSTHPAFIDFLEKSLDSGVINGSIFEHLSSTFPTILSPIPLIDLALKRGEDINLKIASNWGTNGYTLSSLCLNEVLNSLDDFDDWFKLFQTLFILRDKGAILINNENDYSMLQEILSLESDFQGELSSSVSFWGNSQVEEAQNDLFKLRIWLEKEQLSLNLNQSDLNSETPSNPKFRL